MRTILLAEPNPAFAGMLLDELKRMARYQIIHAHSGAEALSLCEQYKPNIAVVDGELPDVNLPDFLRGLRARVAGLPIILMPISPEAVPPEPAVDGFLFKPFLVNDLIGLITSTLGPNPEAETEPTPPARLTGPLKLTGELPLLSRLQANGSINPPLVLKDDVRRAVEKQIEMMSRALRDEPVFLAQQGKVLVMVPRQSQPATNALARVVLKAWTSNDPSTEVLRFEGNAEISRYTLYSVLVRSEVSLSVALRAQIPLPIVRRISRNTASELARILPQ